MSRIRVLLSAVLAASLVFVGGVVAVSASAHTPAVNATCEDLSVDLKKYDDGGTNHVKVTIDGDVVEDVDFGNSYKETFDAPDKYKAYTYSVEVTAWDDPDGSKGYTKTFSGTSTPCQKPGGGHTPVNVCHATSSDTNPYVFITVDDDSVKFKGHLEHRNNPNKTWKSDGVWRGQIVKAGDLKPDLIGDYTDKAGVFHKYDGVIDDKTDCGTFTPPVETKPTGSFTQVCTDTGAEVTIGDLESGTYPNVVWTLTYGSQSKTVVEGEKVAVPGEVQLELSYTSGNKTDTVQSEESLKACPALGKIKVKKVVEGDPIGTSTSFTVRVDCPGTAYDQDLPLNQGNGWINTTGWIPTGTTCSVFEVNVPDGWDPEPDAPVDVTVGTGEPTEVSTVIRNVRRTGRVEIVKLLEGDPAGAGTDFTVQLDCDGSDYDETAVLTAANNWTVTYRGIPSGISCTVTETNVPAGWELKSITPGSFEIDSFATIKVEVTNKRVTVPVETGSVEVRKATVGDPAGATTDFTVLLDCDGTGFDRTLALTAGNAWTARVDGIPAGTQCKVTEPTVPAGWELTSITPAGPFTVQGSTVAKVTVTNARTGVISVTKVLDGATSGASTTFTFDVDCPGTGYDQAVVVNVASGTSATGTTTQIPTGLTCTVTERSTPGWSQTSVVPANGVVAVGSTVTFTNRRGEVPPPGQRGLTVTKAVAPTGTVEFGATLTYSLTVTATGNLPQTNVVVTDPVPAGTTYTAGSAACDGAGPCSPSFANGVVTWGLGSMAAGATRTVTFKVTVNTPEADADGAIPAVTIVNAGAVSSAEVPTTPSNRVETPVTAVQPVKVGPGQPGQPGGGAPEEEVPAAPTEAGALPVTGSGIPAPWLAGLAGILVLMGLALMVVARPTPGRKG